MSRSSSGGRPGAGRFGLLAVAAVVGAVALGALWAQPNGQGERKTEAKKAARAKAQQPAAGQQPAGSTTPAPAAVQPVTRMIGNQQVSVDPATGRLRPPTPEEAQLLAEQLQHFLDHDPEGLQVVQLPDGTYMMDLQDTFQDAVMATKDHKGKVSLHCVNSYEQAQKLLSGAEITTPDGALSPSEGTGGNRRARRPGKTALEVR